ncbi:MAG: flagellar motor switch protein FliM [Firmicutes bacterium]|nr:flagellar motor switch protein FliM [Bacillota bacterium]
MHDILSQEEIDLLIQAATAPQEANEAELIVDDQAIDTYDFSRPNKFSKEHIRGLQRIHEQFCRTFAGLMSAKLRSRLELSVSSITQLTFGDYVRSLPNPSVLTVFDVSPLQGSIVVQFTPEIAFVLHDRLCGGPGRVPERTRSLTDIEVAVFRKQVLQALNNLLKDAWHEVKPLEFGLTEIESNPQFLQVASTREVVALVTINFRLNELHDMMTICLPFRTLEPIIGNLSQARMFESLRRPDPAQIERLKAKVRSAVLPVEVELGSTTVTVQDLLDLDVGDVITLDRRTNETIDVKIGTLTKFKATPGRIGSKIGIVITAVCQSRGGEQE